MNKIVFNDGTSLQPTKIIGVGLNYAAHIDEMQSIRPQEPVLFIKPITSLCNITDPIKIPENKGAVHYELELAVCINKDCSNISVQEVNENIAGFGLAFDLTLRDLQARAKEKGRPWAVAKGFDNSCPVSTFFKKKISEVNHNELKMIINNQLKQHTRTSLMLFKIEELISYISGCFTLQKGDIILTGTPAGVGPLKSGDLIEASIENLVTVKTRVN